MKVVYEETIAELISKAKREAVLNGKLIKHIELTKSEMKRLISECSSPYNVPVPGRTFKRFAGIDLIVVEEPGL